MRKRLMITSLLILSLTLSPFAQVYAADDLKPEDFKEESWAKTIDYLEYVDAYAASHGKPRPPAGAHAYLYMTYINNSGLQLLYAGLSNITTSLGAASFTIPIQTFMMRYKSENESRDVVAASSYLMLMAYNESETTIYPESPDRKDTLYASFSLGFDLSQLIKRGRPALSSEAEIIPLSHSEDKLKWHWGMRYTNLTAMWWRISIDPEDPSYKRSKPAAVAVYEELTFTYNLTFHPEKNSAELVSNYVIGRMTDLWVVDTKFFFIPVIVHYNSTGCYKLDGSKYLPRADETIHQFLHSRGIGMSLVFFQSSAILDHSTESLVGGQEVTDEEVPVTKETISTFTDEGERIFDVDFGSKDTYDLYNSTSGDTTTHGAPARTAKRGGFAKNPIFKIQTFLMNYIPVALASIDESLYEQAKNNLLNMTYADYFYVISYPIYDGYEITHDPTYTAYLHIETEEAVGLPAGIGAPILIFLVVIGVSIAIILFVKHTRKH